jgi:hypothetical protein
MSTEAHRIELVRSSYELRSSDGVTVKMDKFSTEIIKSFIDIYDVSTFEGSRRVAEDYGKGLLVPCHPAQFRS